VWNKTPGDPRNIMESHNQMPRSLRVSLFVLTACGAFAQSAVPTFEVASVKADNLGAGEGAGRGRQKITSDPGSLSMTNVTLKAAVGWAYHVRAYQVTGPGWIDSERYDIVAKAGGAVPEDQLRLMLQQLLADRFKVGLHRETKELAAYVVTVAKGGPKFKESQDEGESEIRPTGRMAISVKRTTMEQLAVLIDSSPLPYAVVDETGLKGRYDFTLDLASFATGFTEHPNSIDDVIQILSQAIQEQLGLRIDQRKTQVEMLTIDHAEKVPTQN